MKYIDAVYKYFNFSSRLEIGYKKTHKESIQISGKLNKNMVLFYLIVCIFTIFISIIVLFSKQIFLKSNIYLILYILSVIIAFALVFIKHKMIFKKIECKPKNINIYQRELPSNLTPAHVRMLVNDGLIDEYTIVSTILDLIDKGYITLKMGNKNNLFNEQFLLSRTNLKYDDLFKYEQFLIDWFFNVCGNSETVSSTQIHEKLISENNKLESSDMFKHFQALVIISFPLEKFYTKNNFVKRKIAYTIMFLIGFFPIFPIVSSFLFIYGLGNLLFSTPLYVLNQTGAEEKDSWLDLKSFLVEFSNIKDKNAEMITLWNYYLTYSVALDINPIAAKEIKDFFGDNIFYRTREIKEKIDMTNYREVLNKQKEQVLKYKKLINHDIEEESKKYLTRAN